MTFGDELDVMTTDVETVFGVAITLRKVAAASFDPLTGQRAETLTDIAVSANRMPVERSLIDSGAGREQVERRRYGVRVASLTPDVPRRGWRIVDGGAELEIVEVDKDVDRRQYVITAERTVNSA